MATPKNTTAISGARGTKVLKATGPDRGSMGKADTSAMLKNTKIGGSRSNLDHSLKV